MPSRSTTRALALALTVTGAADFLGLSAAAPRARFGALRASDAAAGCELETELTVIAANTRFYDAFRDGDLDAMRASWHPSVCSHLWSLKGLENDPEAYGFT